MRPRIFAPRLGLAAALALAAALGSALVAQATPSAGFREDFPGTSTNFWGGGTPVDNPGTDGADGVGDGFLRLDDPSLGNFGARSFNAEYTGDWLAAGIQKVRFALNDIGTDEAFQIHFCIGNGNNFWQYNLAFSPPLHAWQDFEVDLTTSGNFTRIIGSGTFSAALQFTDRILIRHDLEPFVQTPDVISGDLGIDRIVLVGVPVRTEPTTWGRLKALYR